MNIAGYLEYSPNRVRPLLCFSSLCRSLFAVWITFPDNVSRRPNTEVTVGYRAQEHDDEDATGSCSLVEETEKNRK